LIVRPASCEDIAAIGALADEAELFPSEMTAELMTGYLEQPEPEDVWLVAWDEDRLLGFTYTKPEELTNGTYNLLAVATALHARGSGVGTALVGETEQALRGRSARLLLVETSSRPQFADTRRFYAARGFEEVAAIAGFWDDGDDKITFRKDVRQAA
jgi:GNAT superfamily N-acetyltransferase